MRRSSLLFALLLAAPAGAAAQGEGHAYRGPHPMDLDGHWHHDDAVHVHLGLAVGDAPFGVVDGVRIFLADPIAYGYRGTVWTYRGAHPLPGGLPGYCAIDGEHAHAFAPDGPFRRTDAGVYVYRGGLRGGRPMLRPGRMAPAHPIVTDEGLSAVGGPFWFGGCLHRRGTTGGVSPLFGCRPSAIFPRAPRARAPAGPPPARSGGATFRPTRRARAARPPPSRDQ